MTKLGLKGVHKRRERLRYNGKNNVEMVTEGFRGAYTHRREWIFKRRESARVDNTELTNSGAWEMYT